jgi:hypothetical protein
VAHLSLIHLLQQSKNPSCQHRVYLADASTMAQNRAGLPLFPAYTTIQTEEFLDSVTLSEMVSRAATGVLCNVAACLSSDHIRGRGSSSTQASPQ